MTKRPLVSAVSRQWQDLRPSPHDSERNFTLVSGPIHPNCLIWAARKYERSGLWAVSKLLSWPPCLSSWHHSWPAGTVMRTKKVLPRLRRFARENHPRARGAGNSAYYTHTAIAPDNQPPH